MNCVLNSINNSELGNYGASFISEYDLYTPEELYEDEYATAPMMAIHPSFVRDDEEELHTSFEAAISGRLEDLSERLSRLSNASMSSISARNTEPLAPEHTPHTFLSPQMRQPILLGGFGLMCMIGGFDLMGLLMLHMH